MIMTLIEAIKENKQKEFFEILNLKIDLSGKKIIDEIDPEHGGNPLHVATAYGHLHFIVPLIEAGIDVDQPDNDGWTAVYIAADKGYAEIITALKGADADVDKPNSDGVAPIYIATENEHVAAISVLGAAGAKMDALDNGGFTPLCIAAQMGELRTIMALLEAGANASVKTPKGTPLEQAKAQAMRNKEPERQEVVRVLEAHLKQYPNGIKPQMVANRETVFSARPNLPGEQNNPPTVTAKPTSKNNLDSSLSDLSLQVSPVSPIAVPNVVSKDESNQKGHQPVEGVVAEVRRYDNVDVKAKADRDVTTVLGGVRSPGAIDIGGGNTSSSVEASSSSSSNNVKEEAEVDNTAILKKLKLFFMSNKYKGSESADCALYNRVLDAHKAVLVYDEDERVHKLFVNDDPLEPKDSIKMITKMIDSLQLLNAQSTSGTSNTSNSSTASHANTRVQAHAGRDVTTIVGGITAGGALRIGGGDTHRSFMPYNQFKNQNASKYNCDLLNNSGNTQFMGTKIPKAIKPIYDFKI
jgi:hypothetical protein